MKKPTPGPWILSDEPAGWRFTNRYWFVHADQPIGISDKTVESEANAYLIAAAPELLEACMKVSHVLGLYIPSDDVERMSRALMKGVLDRAIKKALG